MPEGRPEQSTHREVLVIGSGFGASMAAWPLVQAGADVLMLERGPWVDRGPHNWAPEGTLTQSPYYPTDGHFLAKTDKGVKKGMAASCVGGPSVFYGGVSFRYREADFLPDPEIVGDSGARWPLTYADLSPSYDQAEAILGVAGQGGEDPTEPPRKVDYPASPNPLSHVSGTLADAARSRGLHPFRLPLAINFSGTGDGRTPCQECDTCDTFPCAVEAKNDLAVHVLQRLQSQGLELRSDTVVTRLRARGGRVTAAECRDRTTGESYTLTADTFILAAGALGSAHVLLSSGLEEMNPASDVVGRYLTRHCSGIVFGAYTWLPRYEGLFHKQIGIHDYYFGDPEGRGPPGKLGNLQQTQTPNVGTVAYETGPLAAFFLKPLVRRITGFLAIAEDRPSYQNRVFVDGAATDELGLPRLRIEHAYDRRDLEARRFLQARAKEIHRSAGALASYVHQIDTFSHALGTVRMGEDPKTAPLDPQGRFRGLENLYVTDGSALPTSAGVNPSLTISANALRVGSLLAGHDPEAAAGPTAEEGSP